MIGKLVGLLGGGIAGKVALAAGGVMLGAIIWLSVDNWLTSGKLDKANLENGIAKQALVSEKAVSASYAEQLEASAQVILDLIEEGERDEEKRLELIAQLDQIRSNTAAVQSSIRELKSHDETVRDYLDQPIPSRLLDCLRAGKAEACRHIPATLGPEGDQAQPTG